jgi:hypothetical protein
MIHESLQALAIPVESLQYLEGNPHVGHVPAIRAMLERFGQMKPITVRAISDDKYEIVAGNHTVRAAKELGWTEVAAVVFDGSWEEARAFALGDNRASELGYDNEALLTQMLGDVIDYFPDVFEPMGWDEFEFAALEEHVMKEELPDEFVPPVIITPPTTTIVNRDEEKPTFTADETVNTQEAVTLGASSLGSTSHNDKKSIIVQYNLVFDDTDQQRRWFAFLRWLKTDPGTDGDTIAERLMYFIDAHANY